MRRTGLLLSVIIPAHNAEKTLRRAVESVLKALASIEKDATLLSRKEGRKGEKTAAMSSPGPAETSVEDAHGNPAGLCEILIIENGSEDGTEAIARTLQLEHPETVRAMCSEKGVSNARNKGLDEAAGEWILFLDADDYLLEEAGAVLRDDLYFTGTDLIVHSYESGHKLIHLCGPGGERYAGNRTLARAVGTLSSGTGGEESGRMPAGTGRDSQGLTIPGAGLGSDTASGPAAEADPVDTGAGTIAQISVRMIENPTRYTSVWSKLFRRERIAYGKLRFDPALRLSEDSDFLIRYLSCCRRIRLSDRPFYHYSTDNVSAVRTWDGEKEKGYGDALRKVQAFLRVQTEEVRRAGAGYGMMQFNLLMVREVFAVGNPMSAREKIRTMKRISGEEPFASAIREYDPKRHRGARYLPVRMLRTGLPAAAAAIYEGRVLQNAHRERMH